MPLSEFKTCQMLTHKSPNLYKLGFDFTKPLETEYLKIQSLLVTEYHINCESMLTIMKKYGIPSSRTMDILFRLFDIEARDLSSAAANAVEYGRSDPKSNTTFLCEWHTSWFGAPVFMRSSYEKNYAMYLDENKIRYEVECFRIKYFDKDKQRFRIAVPDFYLPDTNTIVEVKSTYWLDVENMRAKKAAYLELGFKFKLHLDEVLLDDW